MNRAKTKRFRRSSMDLDFTRRVIDSPAEKANVAAEMRDDIARIQEEKASARAALIATKDQLDEPARETPDYEGGWVPPESPQDFVRQISLAHPNWPVRDTVRMANIMWERYALVRAALVAGLRQGRTLREQFQYGKGWWWNELGPLTPVERTHVLDRVKAVVTK